MRTQSAHLLFLVAVALFPFYNHHKSALAGDVIKLEIKVRKVHEDDFDSKAVPSSKATKNSVLKKTIQLPLPESRDNVDMFASIPIATEDVGAKLYADDDIFARDGLHDKDVVESVEFNNGNTAKYYDDISDSNNGEWHDVGTEDGWETFPESLWQESNSDSSHFDFPGDETSSLIVSSTNHVKTVYDKKHEKDAPAATPYKEPHDQSLPSEEYGSKLPFSGLAEVILANQLGKTLDESYLPLQYNSPHGAKQNQYTPDYSNYGQNLLLYLKFGSKGVQSCDPRDPNNLQWQFKSDFTGQSADNAAFTVHGDEERHGSNSHGKKWKLENAYDQKNQRPQQTASATYEVKNDANSYAVLYSLPFRRYYNNSDPNSAYDYFEGVVESKHNYTIGPTQRFLYRLKFACKTIGVERNPFPYAQVSNSWDDPRLANCGFQIDNNNETGLNFWITATNTGVWANYGRVGSISAQNTTGNSATAQAFIAKRRIGRRARYDTLVDGGIEIDRRQNVVNFYLNGYKVWTINRVGVPPPDDGVTSVNLGSGVPQEASPSVVKVNFGTYKCLDEADPNNPNKKQRLIRVQGLTTYYGANDTFYDNANMKSNQLFGQGAIMTLLKLVLLRAESTANNIVTLPGVYGGGGDKPDQYPSLPNF